MSPKTRVGVLFGGESGEHDVSLVSAKAVIDALARTGKYEIVPVGITREGKWIMHPGAHAYLAGHSRLQLGGPKETFDTDLESVAANETALARIAGEGGTRSERIDVIFPVLHGPKGEDGTVQGMLELAGVAYVGAGVASSALCMDKDLMKRVLRDAGLEVARWVLVRRNDWRRERVATLERAKSLGFPCFIKPANMGSSVGISQARNEGELAAGLDEAARYDVKLLVEEAIDAREIEVSVLGNEQPAASVPGEIIPSGDFYDYKAKYVSGSSQLHIPADLTPELTDRIQARAIDAFLALDCAGMARVDFLVERGSDRICINELNTIPGFTPISMYTKLWEASGLAYDDLVIRLIDLALERHADRADLESSFDIPEDDE